MIKDIGEYLKVENLIRRRHTPSDIMLPHAHEQWEILFCIKGGLEIKTSPANGPEESYYIHSDQIAVIKPSVPHRICFLETSRVCVLEIRETPKNAFIKYIANTESETYRPFKNFVSKIEEVLIVNNQDEIGDSMNLLVNAFLNYNKNKNEGFYKAEYNLYLKKILFGIYKQESQTPANRHNVYINKCASFIHEHFTEDIGIKEIASYIGITPSYIERIFRATYGKTIYAFLREQRLNQAIFLLKNTSLSYKAVAEKSGFKNYVTLYKFFKEQFDCTPKEYRQRAREDYIQYYNNDFHRI